MSTTQTQRQQQTSHRETVFVREYLLDFNGTRAAIVAGYSAKTAAAAASRLLRKVKVQALLKQAMEERQQRLDISVDRVLQQLARIAFCDPRKLFNHDGLQKNIAELDVDTAAAIAGIEIVTGSKITGKSRKASASTWAKRARCSHHPKRRLKQASAR